jgi:YcaO-like protein with predicted kinase domain
MMEYILRLIETEAGTGYFSCVPVDETDFEEGLACLRTHPCDEFMRKHLLSIIASWDEDRLRREIQQAALDDAQLRALFYEASVQVDKFKGIQRLFTPSETRFLSTHSPLIHLKSQALDDHELHAGWAGVFGMNIETHAPLPRPDETGLPELFSKESLAGVSDAVSIEEIRTRMKDEPIPGSRPRPDPDETVQIALERLADAEVAFEEENRHESSLSPIGLLRRWHVNISVKNGRHDFQIFGPQTAYGRGLSLSSARASYAMEMVERCSSFAGFDPKGASGYLNELPLVNGSYSELLRGNVRPVDPNALALEVPYNNEPLWWIPGRERTQRGEEPVWVPAQCVFLFCNLDEIKLFSGLGSTGLASGNTLDEAKVSGLLEIIERDSEAVTPYDPSRCFHIETQDEQMASLLSSYAERGIHVQFQDLTLPMGVPCCKCFVIDLAGRIIKGTGAHLNARRALISAMTETPYPYPYGPPSRTGMYDLIRVPLENLPDYSTGTSAGDLSLLENLFTANGYNPIYVDLTRKDLNIPVVRAIVPGMEITANFDRFSRIPRRLYASYLKMFC